jgi:chromosomal replication initiator protein
MTKDHIGIWDKCKELIKEEVSELVFKTWFDPIKAISLNQGLLILQVPNNFFYEWIEKHYVDLLRKAIRTYLGNGAKLEYQILMSYEDDKNANFRQKKPVNKTENDQSNTVPNELKNPFVIPGIKKLNIDPQLNKNYRFSNFIEADCNRLARSAGMAIADKPGYTSFNPLIVYGGVGLGKTHLIQAIGNEILSKHENKNVLYLSSDSFTNQIIHAIRNNSINDFVSFYHLIDVLIIDDIQFLASKTKTQEIFFHIFNELHQSKKQIILSSDRAPKDMKEIDERLISRFKWGLVADLQAPDIETRMAILQSKMEKYSMELAPNLLEYISFHIKDNIRELEGVLSAIQAHASFTRKKIDLVLVREVIERYVSEMSQGISMEGIKELVAKEFNVDLEKVNGKSRKREIVIARQLSMYLCKNFTDKSLKSIGEHFGGKDHSTVIYSCKAIQDMIETDIRFAEKVSQMEHNLKLAQTAGVMS